MAHKVLIVEDNKYLAAQYKMVLEKHGYDIKIVFDSDELFEEYEIFQPEVIVVNMMLTYSTLNGIQITRALVYDYKTKAKILAISAEASPLELKEIRKLGVFTFIEKGETFNLNYLIVNIENAIKYSQNEDENKNLLHHNKNLKKQILSKHPFLGISKKIRTLKEDIINATIKDQSLIIYGAPGTGKHICVNYYYNNSPRFGMPFIQVNCRQLSNEIDYQLRHSHLDKSEIISRKLTELIEENDSGIIHFDELANLSNGIQLILVKYIEQAKSSSNIPIFLFTTSNTMGRLRAKKSLNSKLKEILKNNYLLIPSLSNRGNDLAILFKYFMETMSDQYFLDCEMNIEEIKDMLKTYNWPGNVVELKNFCKNIALKYKIINNKVIKSAFRKLTSSKDCNECTLDLYEMDNFKEAVVTFERNFLTQKLKQHNWKMSEVSRTIKIERSTLYKKINQLNIEREENIE
ncbi:sigma-54-dependent Fis family transcriptional regulator [bacterium]|nr:sigma-54-dependent Fis family transcriptional regulator [bacterium]